jgi:hypothetical protein
MSLSKAKGLITGPTIVEGPAKLKVLRQNLPARSAPPIANRKMDKATQRVASSWHFLGDHRGDLAPSSFVSESQLGGFRHALHVGWHLAIWVFPIGITQESHVKPPSQDLPKGAALAPIWSYGEVLALVGPHPWTGDPGSTQILTRQCGAQSQTMPTRQVPVVQPLQVIETPEYRVGAYFAPTFDNPNGPVGLH